MSLSPPPSSGDLSQVQRELSPEQVSRMEKNKMEAEARLFTRRLGAETIGPTWMQALLPEFKKPYMEKVSFPQQLQINSVIHVTLLKFIKMQWLLAVDCICH